MHGFSVSLSSFLIYQNCVEARFECGNISIGYPFFGGDRWPECGHPGLELLCDGHTNRTTIDMVGVKYEVMDIHRVLRTLRLAREDLLLDNGFCRPQTPIKDSIIDSELFELGPPPPPVLSYTNITLSYDCPSSMSSPWNLGNFSCNNDSDYKNVSITMDKFHLDGCSDSVTATVFQSNWTVLKGDPSLLLLLKVAMATGFQVKWKEDTAACRKCNASGGACGFNLSNKQTFCYCPHGNQTLPNECSGQD